MRLSRVIGQVTRIRVAFNLTEVIVAHRQALVLPILGAGLLLRLWDIAQPFIGYHMWNEVYYATIAENFKSSGLLSLMNYNWMGGSPLSPRFGPSPFVSWLLYLSSSFLGAAEWANRLPILILGMLSLIVIYQIARELYDAEVGLVAILFASLMPGIAFFSRQIALDGPMVAFGLAGFWLLLLVERHQKYWLILPSAICLATAIFIKYTGVLFIPPLAWIWLEIIRHSAGTKRRAMLLLAFASLFVAVLPAGAWFLFERNMSAVQGTADPWSGYLSRAYEWNPVSWYLALQSLWTRTQEQVGRILWYPFVIIGALALAAGRVPAFIRHHTKLILLIVPWFAQMIYPMSWFQNDAYFYPALYGTALLFALIVKDVASGIRHSLALSSRSLQIGAGVLVLLFCISSVIDYKEVYHSWYSTEFGATASAQQMQVNTVTPDYPFLSAKLVLASNYSHEAILADIPATLYYAQGEHSQERSTWLWWGFPDERVKMIEAIESRRYAYVVFAYRPPVEIVEALPLNGYRRIGPAAWERFVLNRGHPESTIKE